jgi:hypothetical protein
MTVYAYRITLDDGELTSVKTALEHYRKICEAELSAGPKCPYWAHARDIDSALRRLRDAETVSLFGECPCCGHRRPEDAG